MAGIPQARIRLLNAREPRNDGKFVLYWMVANRRTRFNFALQHAVDHARRLSKPLLILEGLRSDYRWACERFHRFVIDGMADNAARCLEAGVTYYPYVEPRPGAGKGLIAELSRHACLVVTDDFPAFFLPRMLRSAGRQSHVRLEAVDSNGLLPLGATDRAFPTAHAFRRFLQKQLREHLECFPKPDPLARCGLRPLNRLPGTIARRWPRATPAVLSGNLGALPVERSVATTAASGGPRAARSAMRKFEQRFDRYLDERNHPDAAATSGLSPYLHFGHLSSHEVCGLILDRERWSSERLARGTSGSREGWWGLSPSAEAFLDQLVTWRELGYNMCRHREDHDRYESLPSWALETLERHASDPREQIYTLKQFEEAATHDPLWNAAQRQLLQEGTIHNYLRMLWGKKILEWTAHPREALEIMVELNNKYALDGRNPNSYSGIFWVLGRYDRAWGPERPIYGKVRYMTSRNTARKLKLKRYLERFGEPGPAAVSLF